MAAKIEVGSVIASRYELKSLIGEGGMASVWRAEDRTLKRMVAVKLLYVRGQRDPQVIVDQFLREARIAASVQHRNVIHTVDFGIADEQLPYMVMELLNGESWADRNERQPPLTMEEVVHLASLTLRGLAAVHEGGVVHRDLKPQNIFLHRDMDTVYPKILDFGISRSLAAEDGEGLQSAISTQDGMIVGTPDYMSPEQARGEKDIDKRADIYSMGAIIYEGICGRLPYEADTIGQLIVKIVTTPAPNLRSIRPDVPELLADCVMQAMAHDREERFVDATVFRRALLSAAEKAFSAQVRRPNASEAPPRSAPMAAPAAPPPAYGVAPVPPAALAPAPLPLALAGLPPSAAGAAGPAAWGDFEGLDSRGAKRPAQDNPKQAIAAVAAAMKDSPAPKPSSDRQHVPGSVLDPSLLGDSPFDALGAQAQIGSLDIDYDRGMRSGGGTDGNLAAARPVASPVQRAAVQYAKGQTVPRAAAAAAAPAKRQAARGYEARGSGSLAIWAIPGALLFLLLLVLCAPGLFSPHAPDRGAAAALEAKNPATAGSERQLSVSRRHDLAGKPVELRDVLF